MPRAETPNNLVSLIRATDGVKITNQLTLKWKDYSTLSWWTQRNHMGS